MNNENLETTETTSETVLETQKAAESTEIPADLSTEPLATEVQTITIDVVHEVRDDIVHANLFGSFLICGAIVAAALFGRWLR